MFSSVLDSGVSRLASPGILETPAGLNFPLSFSDL
jgi:hypothetical protein